MNRTRASLALLALFGQFAAGCWQRKDGTLPPATGDSVARYVVRIAPEFPLRDSLLQCYVAGLDEKLDIAVDYRWQRGRKEVAKGPRLAPRFFRPGDSVACSASFNAAGGRVYLSAASVVIPKLTLQALRPKKVALPGLVSPLTGKIQALGSAVVSFEADTEVERHKCSFDEALWSQCRSGTTKLKDVEGWSALPDGDAQLYVRGVYHDTESASQTVPFEKKNTAPRFVAEGSAVTLDGLVLAGDDVFTGRTISFLPKGIDVDGDALLYRVFFTSVDSTGHKVSLAMLEGNGGLRLDGALLREGTSLDVSVEVLDTHGGSSGALAWKTFRVKLDPGLPSPSPTAEATAEPTAEATVVATPTLNPTQSPTPLPTPIPTPVALPPQWKTAARSFTLPEDGAIRLTFATGMDFEPGTEMEGMLSMTAPTSASHGVLSQFACVTGSCGVTYTPTADFFGTDNVTLRITGAAGVSTDLPVSLVVTNVNDAPEGNFACSPSSQIMKTNRSARDIVCTGAFDVKDAEAVHYEADPAENGCALVAGGTGLVFHAMAPSAVSLCSTRLRARDASGTLSLVTTTVTLQAADHALDFSVSQALSVDKTCAVNLQGSVSFALGDNAFASAQFSGSCLSGASASASGLFGGRLDGGSGACDVGWFVTDNFGITEGVKHTVTPASLGVASTPVPLEFPVARGGDVVAGAQPEMCGSGCTGTRSLLSSGASAKHQCAASHDGRVSCWGEGGDGQLSVGAPAPFTADGRRSSTASYPVRAADPGNMGQFLDVTDVKGLAAGSLHTCFLFASGEVRCSGNTGAIGGSVGGVRQGVACANGDTLCDAVITGAVSIQAGADFTCALVTSNRVTDAKCWGAGDRGQLGNKAALGISTGATAQASLTRRTPVSVEFPTNAKPLSLATGGDHACAIIDLMGVRKIMCWGSNAGYKLGTYSAVPVNHFAFEPKDVNMALVGQTIAEIPSALALGETHSCLLLDTGRVACWGANPSGQLGVEPLDRLQLTRPATNNGCADCVGGIDGTTVKAIALAAGRHHTCALTAAGTVHCWGDNAKGQLGVDPVTKPLVADSSQAITLSQDGSPFVAVSAGEEHTCAATANGLVMCWGEKSLGRLGDAQPIVVLSLPNATPAYVRLDGSSAFEAARKSCAAWHTFTLSGATPVR